MIAPSALSNALNSYNMQSDPTVYERNNRSKNSFIFYVMSNNTNVSVNAVKQQPKFNK